MKKRIFHISDLHLIDGWHEEQGVVLNEFFKNIDGLIDESSDPYLVFSGDLVNSGGTLAHFEEFYHHFEPLLSRFPDKNHRICCAGNHDIDRKYVEENIFMLEAAAAANVSEGLFNDLVNGQLSKLLKPKFSKFDAFQLQHFGTVASGDNYFGASRDFGEIGFYVLNSALLSFGGAKNAEKTHSIDDRRKLNVETRNLHAWLHSTQATFKILVVHHPLDWLTEECEKQLRIVIQKNFNLVLSGHIHEANPHSLATAAGLTVTAIAPALFEAKEFANGYAYIDVDTESADIKITYKTWNPSTQTFIPGNAITGTESGTLEFNTTSKSALVKRPGIEDMTTYFETKFREALKAYSSLSDCWITPQLSPNPEYGSNSAVEVLGPMEVLLHNKRVVISAPPRFGLTTLGRYIAQHHWKSTKKALITISFTDMPLYDAAFSKVNNAFLSRFGLSQNDFAGYIIETDGIEYDKVGRLIKCIDKNAPEALIVFLNTKRSLDNMSGNSSSKALGNGFKDFYLTSLARSAIREIVRAEIDHGMNASEDILTDRIVSDIDNINIHRTPFHAKVLLGIAKKYFDVTPLNMTEVHSLQLSAAILSNMPVGTYDTAPDTKDCCYALGLFCANLIKSDNIVFQKHDFLLTINLYCADKSVDLNVDLLFSCLTKEKIIIPYGSAFKFNYIYWIYFFGAHHMITDDKFKAFIMEDRNYAKYEEMIEYYSGIDRRRTDLIRSLCQDLSAMNEDFGKRSNIKTDVSVYEAISWKPSLQTIDAVNDKIDQIADDSNLPVSVKDALADKSFDPSRPYRQELRSFITGLSLGITSRVMIASAKAIRNSDHVDSNDKLGLLREIFIVWRNIIHATLIVSPILVRDKVASYEDILFILDSSFDDDSPDDRLLGLIRSMPAFMSRIVSKDLSTKRTGPLFFNFLETETDELLRFFAITQVVITKPYRWRENTTKYIDRCNKNSFFLYGLRTQLLNDRRIGYNSIKDIEDIEYLVSYIHAKHDLNSKSPSDTLVRRVRNELTFGPIQSGEA